MSPSRQLRALARSFVVTVAAVTSVGCHKEPDPIRAENPGATPSQTTVTTTTASASATETPTASATMIENPPVAVPKKKRKRTAAAPTTFKYPPGASPSWSDLEPKSPADADGRTIYVDATDGCYVEVPKKTPPKFPVAPGMRMMDSMPVDCPAVVDDPAWDECQHGPLMKHKTKAECYCMPLGGNPPPPPRLVTCPKK
jgi:hypothetical protein